jgi:hypothetical protein
MLDFLFQFNQFSSSKLFSLTAAAAVVVGQPTSWPVSLSSRSAYHQFNHFSIHEFA